MSDEVRARKNEKSSSNPDSWSMPSAFSMSPGHHAAALVVREEHRAVFVDGVEGHEEGAVVGADDVVAGTADFPLRGHIDVLVEVFGLVRRKDLDHGVLLLPQSF